MDYTEAELEARIFPSVDLDPRDWEEEDLYIMPGDRDDDDDDAFLYGEDTDQYDVLED
jgi:hypothetical protein